MLLAEAGVMLPMGKSGSRYESGSWLGAEGGCWGKSGIEPVAVFFIFDFFFFLTIVSISYSESSSVLVSEPQQVFLQHFFPLQLKGL